MAYNLQSELEIEITMVDRSVEDTGLRKTHQKVSQGTPVRLAQSKVILGEIQNVMAIMRLNSRWSDPIRNVRTSLGGTIRK